MSDTIIEDQTEIFEVEPPINIDSPAILVEDENALTQPDQTQHIQPTAEQPSDQPEMSRNIRQKDIVPDDELKRCQIIVVGCGAVGHQLGVLLASLGAVDVLLIDHDKVGIENMSSQGFSPGEIGQNKALTVAMEMQDKYPDMSIGTIQERFSEGVRRMIRQADDSDSNKHHVIVFSCVDSMAARKEIWTTMDGVADLFIDSRMGAQTGRVISVVREKWQDYLKSWHTDAEAHEAPCTAKATHYCASIVAALAISRFVKYLRHFDVEPQVRFDLPMGDMFVEKTYG